MTTLNIPCPNCGFSLIVANRLILGRPARCPQCQLKFVLKVKFEIRDTENDDEEIADPTSRSDANLGIPVKDMLGAEEIVVDETIYYVTTKQIQEWLSIEDAARFRRWAVDKTTVHTPNGTDFFLEDDYDEWLSLGMPDAN